MNNFVYIEKFIIHFNMSYFSRFIINYKLFILKRNIFSHTCYTRLNLTGVIYKLVIKNTQQQTIFAIKGGAQKKTSLDL